MKYALISMLLIPICLFSQTPTPATINHWKDESRRVTIIRDKWGVPHVYGMTDADAVFGFGYAQAEDAFDHLEDNYIRALGRAAEVYGEKEFQTDVVTRAFEIPRIAREEFNEAPEQMKKIYLAYADGVNFFLYNHPEKKTVLLKKIDPWYPLAFLRYKYYIKEWLTRTGFKIQNFKVEYNSKLNGSNAWAIAPSKTTIGHAMLFINPHTNYNGIEAFYEAHIVSDEGWNFSGATRLGLPLLYIGHNDHLGWALTDNHIDEGDLYTETFDNAKDTLAYKYGNGYRHASIWKDTLTVNNNGKKEKRIITRKKTHHGPVFRSLDGKEVAVRLINFEKTGWLDQYYAMTKSRSLTEFKTALAAIKMPYNNLVYADADGNIYYLYNGAIPVKDTLFNWNAPVDGSDPRTEWKGYHKFSELPQILNPKDGFVMSCNNSPFATLVHDNLKREDYPFYNDNWEEVGWRAERSHELLSDSEKFSFDKFQRTATDTKVYFAKFLIDSLNVLYKKLKSNDSSRASALAPVMNELNGWDYVSSKESVPIAVFNATISQFFFEENSDMIAVLERGIADLEKKWGTWKVPYGTVNRLQRIDWLHNQPFSDDRPSIPSAGGYGGFGIIFCIYTNFNDPAHNTKSNYGVGGNTYVNTTEFGKNIQSSSILFFGESEDPKSPHYFDQAPLYADGKFKEAYFQKEDVVKNAERRYHPGEK